LYDFTIIFSVKTEIAYLRKGYAFEIIKRFISKNKKDIFLHVYSDNLAAIKLYEKLGFHKTDSDLKIGKYYKPKLPTKGELIQMVYNY